MGFETLPTKDPTDIRQKKRKSISFSDLRLNPSPLIIDLLKMDQKRKKKRILPPIQVLILGGKTELQYSSLEIKGRKVSYRLREIILTLMSANKRSVNPGKLQVPPMRNKFDAI